MFTLFNYLLWGHHQLLDNSLLPHTIHQFSFNLSFVFHPSSSIQTNYLSTFPVTSNKHPLFQNFIFLQFDVSISAVINVPLDLQLWKKANTRIQVKEIDIHEKPQTEVFCVQRRDQCAMLPTGQNCAPHRVPVPHCHRPSQSIPQVQSATWLNRPESSYGSSATHP